jgi:hypothetical protein
VWVGTFDRDTESTWYIWYGVRECTTQLWMCFLDTFMMPFLRFRDCLRGSDQSYRSFDNGLSAFALVDSSSSWSTSAR